MAGQATKRLASRATYAAYRAGGAIATTFPSAITAPLARSVARGLWAALPERRAMVARHMRRAHGPGLSGPALRRAVRAVFESYARYWLESFRLPALSTDEIRAGMDAEGLEHIEHAFAAGRGAVVAVPHLGGWDFAGAWLALQGYKALVVAEALEPPELFEWFASWRRQMGMDVVPADAGAGTAVLEALKQGRIVGLVSDRDIARTGVEVEFFGETTTLPAGPAVLALRTGAPLIPAAVYFEGRTGHHGVIRPPIPVAREGRFRDDVVRLTQALAHELEALVRAAPEQWHLMQPNWPSDPGYGR